MSPKLLFLLMALRKLTLVAATLWLLVAPAGLCLAAERPGAVAPAKVPEASGAGPAAVSTQKLVALALLPGEGERAPAESAFARLESALSADAEFALVERAQIRQVLREHTLSASGLTEPATAARLGQLLSADLFLFIEKLPVQAAPSWRVQIVEARSGVVLCSLVERAESFTAEPSLLSKAVRLAVAKFRNPPERRHFVALLSVRAEERDRRLEPLAAALSSLLPVELNASPDLVLLDREHLQHLRDEERVTGREAALKTSAILLEAGLRHGAGTNSLAVTLIFRPLAGGEPARCQVVVPADNFSALRQAVAAAAREHFHAAAPTGTVVAARDEAIVFARRAQLFLSFGQADEAARAGEAAVALYPHPEICLVAFESVNAARMAWAPKPLQNHSQETKVQFLKAVLRELELEELGREFAARHPQEAEQPLALSPGGGWSQGPEWQMEIHPDELEAMELRREVFERHYARHLRRLEEYARRWNEPAPAPGRGEDPQGRWLKEAWEGVRMLKYWAVDNRQWASNIQAEINRVLTPPGPLRNDWGNLQAVGWMQFSDPFPAWRSRSAEEGAFVREVLQHLAGQTNAAFRLAVCRASLNTTSGDPSNVELTWSQARTLLDVFLREMPLSHPARHWSEDRDFPRYAVEQAFGRLPEGPEKTGYGKAILEPIIAAGDWRRLEQWREVFDACVVSLAPAERTAWAERVLAGVSAPAQRQALVPDGAVEKFLEQELPGRLAPRNSWAKYELRPLLSGRLPDGEIMTSLVQGQELILAWVVPLSGPWAEVTVTRLPLAGGALRVVGEALLPSENTGGVGFVSHEKPDERTLFRLFFVKPYTPHICYLAADGETVAVATLQGGLAVWRAGKKQTFFQGNGLPVDEITALGLAGGKVFLGTSGLFEFDPATAAFHELATSLSSQERNPLDGGRDYRVRTLATAQADGRPCLLIGTFEKMSSAAYGAGKNGWRYDPTTGRFTKIDKQAVAPRRPSLGAEEFEAGNGLRVFTRGERSPTTTIVHLPDGRPLSPMRDVQQAEASVLLVLPREVWSLKSKEPASALSSKS